MPPRPPRRGGMGRGFGGPPPRGFGGPPPPPMGFGRRRPPPPPPRFGRPYYRRRGCGCLPFVMVALGAVVLALALLL